MTPFVANIRTGSTEREKGSQRSPTCVQILVPAACAGSWVPCILRRTERKRFTEERIGFAFRQQELMAWAVLQTAPSTVR